MIEVEAIHRVCLAVRDREAAEAFYMDVLSLGRHHRVKGLEVPHDS